LGHVQPLCRAREIAFFGYSDEIAKMPQFHLNTSLI
jgi:hypothetical protein